MRIQRPSRRGHVDATLKNCARWIAATWLFAFAAPVLAHHSFAAEFDRTKPVTLTGEVTKLEWLNPHAYLHLDVKDEQTGRVTTWTIELGSPNSLSRLGWKRDSVRVGDRLTIHGIRGKFKAHLANARSAVLARTGQKLGAASSEKR